MPSAHWQYDMLRRQAAVGQCNDGFRLGKLIRMLCKAPTAMQCEQLASLVGHLAERRLWKSEITRIYWGLLKAYPSRRYAPCWRPSEAGTALLVVAWLAMRLPRALSVLLMSCKQMTLTTGIGSRC